MCSVSSGRASSGVRNRAGVLSLRCSVSAAVTSNGVRLDGRGAVAHVQRLGA